MNSHRINAISYANAAQGRAVSLAKRTCVLFGALPTEGGLSS